ncbi:helix-turn-helix domain-containing protein [Actinomadura decatromicini]|uniref:Helix-turn-helix domain-containing protein n=1 Tax=Actinomadura decatromicini TaxID=2604572 RepID=A0A5D3FRL2_9ACTN|nr:helix-turn-helix transcriptional regulator [Actinomadura decatromicini]TYK50873.1 helix-turn-helix domain-containing protein [Actinomadura decatromicini]
MTENRARVFFGEELRRMRDKAGLTGKQLADALGCTPQWISMMESGRKVSEQSAHDLDTFFKTDGHFHRHWKLINDVELQAVLPPGFAQYAEDETKANSVRAFSGFLVNGLFQTEDYAAAVMGTAHGSRVPELVAKRMERQAIFHREDPPLTWLTIDEVILHRVIGSSQVMRGQLEALLKASEQPGVVIEVMPFRAGYHVGLTGDFTMLGFSDGTSIAYTESAGIGTLIRTPDKIADFVVRWDSLRGYALPIGESRAAIKAAMEAL